MNKPFDENLIGHRIAIGGEHKVYRYGSEQVIKFPFGPRYWFSPGKYCENLRRDESLVRRYFSHYLVEREILFFEDNSRITYVIIEPKISGRHFLRSDLADPEIYRQFQEMVEINKRFIEQEHLSVEFFGLRGLLFKGRWEAANVMINPAKKELVITDAGVMHFGRNEEHQIVLSWLTDWGMRKQKKLIALYLK